MDCLPQYGSHAFIPYPSDDSEPSAPASPSSTASFDDITASKPHLSPLSLLNTSAWTYCGPLLSPDASSLPPSFHTWCSSTIRGSLLARLLPFLRFLNDFLQQAGAHHYWLTIRATKPTSEYDTVRWHTDDIFFDYDGEKDRMGWAQKSFVGGVDSGTQPEFTNRPPNVPSDGLPAAMRKPDLGQGRKQRDGYWKLASTLLGPGTLFLKDGGRARRIQREAKQAECRKRGEHTCTQFRCLGCLDAVEAVRETLAKEFANEEVESPEYGEVAFFRLGDEEGAVHSEPPCHTDRIFINVVPGTEDELKALMSRWGLHFPRAWCFGVPVAFDERDRPTSLMSPTLSSTESSCYSMRGEEDDTRSESWSLSTMSMNLKEEYTEWLKEKGFQFAQIFGQMGGGEKKDDNGRFSRKDMDRESMVQYAIMK